MGKVKHCAFPGCNSDTRYAHKPHMKDVQFTSFPGPKHKPVSCREWAQWLSKYKPGFTFEKVKYETFLCSKHLDDEFFHRQKHNIKLKPIIPKKLEPALKILQPTVSILKTASKISLHPRAAQLVSVAGTGTCNVGPDDKSEEKAEIYNSLPLCESIEDVVSDNPKSCVRNNKVVTVHEFPDTQLVTESIPDTGIVKIETEDTDITLNDDLVSDNIISKDESETDNIQPVCESGEDDVINNPNSCVYAIAVHEFPDVLQLVTEDVLESYCSPILESTPTEISEQRLKTVEETFLDFKMPKGWFSSLTSEGFKMMKPNEATGGVVIGISVDAEFNLAFKICNKLLSDHPLLGSLTYKVLCVEDLQYLFENLNKLHICEGADEKRYKQLYEERSNANSQFCWITNNTRHIDCALLSQLKRCGPCLKLKDSFRKIVARNLTKKTEGKISSYRNLGKTELVSLIKKLKVQEKSLKKKLERRKAKAVEIIGKNDSPLNESSSE